VRTVPLLKLHRLGVSLIGKLRRLATALVGKNPFACFARPWTFSSPRMARSWPASREPDRPSPELDTPPAPGERPFASLADIAVATLAVGRAAAAVEMVTGLGVRPQQLTPEALEALAKAAGGGAKATIDPASIDTGVLARTVLVARLLSGQPAPCRCSHAAIEKFKQDFNSGSQTTWKAQRTKPPTFFRQSGQSATLEGPGRRSPRAGLPACARWARCWDTRRPSLRPTGRAAPMP
jgi:hypothetical protein